MLKENVPLIPKKESAPIGADPRYALWAWLYIGSRPGFHPREGSLPRQSADISHAIL